MKRFGSTAIFAVFGAVLILLQASAVESRPEEMAIAKDWINTNLEPNAPVPPFTFSYGSQSSNEFLRGWRCGTRDRKLNENRSARTLTFTDPNTGLQLKCESVEYNDFPTIEWTLYFKNTGSQDTPVISNIRAVNTIFTRPDTGEFVLHRHAGSQATSDDYRPFTSRLGPNFRRGLGSKGGRGSDTNWPYFNIEWPDGGVIVAIGWPGQWTAIFERDDKNHLNFTAGQEQTYFKLLPGEEVRSPLIVIQFYRGDWLRGQNIWRQWMLKHNVPRLNGKLPPPMLSASSGGQFNEMQGANEQNQKQFIDGYIDNRLKIDFWWMDAGWYVNGTSWPNVGTWEVDRTRFPNGLRAVSDHAHSRDVNILIWFEPERVTPNTWLYKEHPEWLLGPDGQQKLLDLGNDRAREWLINHIDKMLTDEGIDIYRQDFNFEPLWYWRANDANDRRGITEIKHVTGYLAFWDELRHRRPGLLIDTCASGGRRNDLETLRRSIPLHKSDFDYGNATGRQTQLYGIAFWVPYYGAPVVVADHVDVYAFRSGIAPLTGMGYDMRRTGDYDFALLCKLIDQRNQIVPYIYFGDYYPLTEWSFAEDAWIAWQFNRPELDSGLVQAFRRSKCESESTRLKLHDLDRDAKYEVANIDQPEKITMTGGELTDTGLEVIASDRPAALVFTYKKLK